MLNITDVELSYNNKASHVSNISELASQVLQFSLLINVVMIMILIVFVMMKLMEIELVMTYIATDIGHGDLLL